jgi:hypothetical protein
MSSVSRAIRSRFSSLPMKPRVRMLCSRSGQLHQQHTHVARDGQDELAQVLGLRACSLCSSSRESLVTPSTSSATSSPNRPAISGPVGRGVLDHVVQQGGDDGGGVHPVLGQDARHLDRMGEIGIARSPGLGPVHVHGVDIGAVQQRLVGGRVVASDALDKLVLAQVLRGAGRGRDRGAAGVAGAAAGSR